FFPAEAVFVRLSCRGTNGNLQVNSFEYDAPLARPLPDVEGESHFLEVLQSSPEVAVSVREVQEPDAGGQWKIEGTLTNFTDSPLNIEWASALDSDLLE